MILSPLSNGLIEALNRFQGGSQLLNERLRHEGMGDEDPLVSRQGPGPFDGLKPLVDALLTPQVMLTKGKRSRGKLFENQWVNFLGFAHRFC